MLRYSLSFFLLLAGCGDGACDRSSDCGDGLSCVGSICQESCAFLDNCQSSNELCHEGQCREVQSADACALPCNEDHLCVEGAGCCTRGSDSLACDADCTRGACCGNGTCDEGEDLDVCAQDCGVACTSSADCTDPATPSCAEGSCRDGCPYVGSCPQNEICVDQCEATIPLEDCTLACDSGIDQFCYMDQCCRVEFNSLSCRTP